MYLSSEGVKYSSSFPVYFKAPCCDKCIKPQQFHDHGSGFHLQNEVVWSKYVNYRFIKKKTNIPLTRTLVEIF